MTNLWWTQLHAVVHFNVPILHVDVGDCTGQFAQRHALRTIWESVRYWKGNELCGGNSTDLRGNRTW